jgi:Zn-dependent metalloprotease
VHYDQGYDNAYWDGSQMTYGDGDGTIFKSFVILDVCGHEITHGVTQFESNLEYQDEPGALNESHSDVFGKLIEAFSKKQTVDKVDWVLGRGIFMPNIKGEGIRNMMHPGTAYDDPSLGKDPQPAHYKDLYKGWDDNGGVHYNSGIVNRAFALFATDVGGYPWEKAGVIWYAARAAAGATPSFAQFAWHTLDQSAKVNSGAHTPALKNAWDAVGVVPQK